MLYVIEKNFAKSAKDLPKDVQLAIFDFIKTIETADKIIGISNIKKLKTNKKDNRECYRYKIGNYRLGFVLEGSVIRFVIVDHRKNIYNDFP